MRCGGETPVEPDTDDSDVEAQDAEVVDPEDTADVVEDDVEDVTEEDDAEDAVEEETWKVPLRKRTRMWWLGVNPMRSVRNPETSPCEMAVCMPDNTCLVIANDVPDCCESLLDCDDGNAVTVDSCPGPGQSCTHTRMERPAHKTRCF